MNSQQLLKLSNKINAEIRKVPVEEQWSVIKKHLAEVPNEADRMALENLILPGWQAHDAVLDEKRTAGWKPWIALGFAALLTVIAFLAPNPTPFQLQIIRIVASCFAAYAAVVFSGELKVEAKWGDLAIQATAGFGVWVIVYYTFPTR